MSSKYKKPSSTPKSDLVYVAKLGKSVGLKGQLKLFIDSDFPEQFKKDSLFITNKNLTLKIESVDLDRNIIKFFGIDNVDDAKRLTNQLLYTTLEDTRKLCSLDNDQFFWFDLIGCSIVENGKVLGAVKDIHRYPITDYFDIETDKELLLQDLPKSFLIPYDKKYIKEVDIRNKSIETSGAFEILENS